MLATSNGESWFHSGGQIEDDEIENQYAYVNLGGNRPEEIEDELKESTHLLALERIIDENKSVFGIQLESGGPARIPLMKINLDRTKSPVKVRAHIYSLDQRKILNAIFEKLMNMCFLKVFQQAAR